MKTPAVCESAAKWIKAQKGKQVLAAFTGQDYQAFRVFMHAVELWAYSDQQGREAALLCMRYSVLAMQPKTRWIARETIPHLMDWTDRQLLWPLICGDLISVEREEVFS